MQLTDRVIYAASGIVWKTLYRGICRPTAQTIALPRGSAVTMTESAASHAVAA
jgi:hypothetical protein